MLRNRRSNARKKIPRRRNTTRVELSENSSNSDDWDVSSLSEFDSSEITDESSLSSNSAPRRLNNRKCLRTKRRNARNSNKTNRRRNNIETSEPGRASTSSSNCGSRRRNLTSKRKCKGRSNALESEESSSDDHSMPIQVKRLRHSYLDSDDSDDSIVQPVSSRRAGFIKSESSSSASSSEIDIRRIRSRPGFSSQLTWSSDDTDDSVVNTAFENRNVMNGDTGSSSSTSSSSSSFGSLSSSSLSSSLFSSGSPFHDIFNLDMSSTSNDSSNQELTTSFVNTREQISSDSDDSDSDGEKCAICLKKFRTQQIGSPSNCDHCFCRKCLEEWSKSSTTCPVDRSIFDAIVVRSEIGGEIVERIAVQNRNFVIFPPMDIEEMDTISCEMCGLGDDEETLLLCDICNRGYHMACLTPPLEAVPAGSWYCPPCRLTNRNLNQNVREAMRHLISSLPFSNVTLSQHPSRQNQNRSRSNRTRIPGPPPRGRGPTVSRRLANARARNNLTNVIGEYDNPRVAQQRRSMSSGQHRMQNGRSQWNNASDLASQMARYLVEVTNSGTRIDRRRDGMLTLVDSHSVTKPSEIVDMVFPSFSLFGNDDLEYFSDDQNGDVLDGEVAIMARVRSEYSARRRENRKSIVTNLMNPRRRNFDAPMIEMNLTEDCSSTASLLDSILESQTLWHSKNVEISSKKDGKLEIRLKNNGQKKPDLSNSNHSSKEIPLYPNKNDNSTSDTNKSYANNTRYSNFGNNSNSGSSSFTQSTSFFNSLNPSTRPGFSNLLGNNSSALDLSPFRGTAPIRFRMNPPRSGLRRSNYNANTRHTGGNASVTNNNMPSSRKPSSAQSVRCGSGEDDVDLYDDIDTENSGETDRATELYASLEPPPEPPALLIGSDSSSDEDNGLIIDDKPSGASKSNIYDPTEPNEDSDEENDKNRNSNIAPGYMRSPSYGSISDFGPHLPLPEPPALPIELESVNNSDSDEEAEFPNMTLYSKTSITLANNVQDIPIPDTEYPSSLEQNEFLDGIPIPTPTTSEKTETEPNSQPISELYSPSKKASSDSDSDVEETTETDDGKKYITTFSTRSSDHEPSSSDGRDSSSDREISKARHKKYAKEVGKKKKKMRSRSVSSENETNEEDREFSPDEEKRSSVCRSSSSSIDEDNFQKSIRKSSDGGMSDGASPKRRTSFTGENVTASKTHEPDLSEICDITSKDSIDVEIIESKVVSEISNTDEATENEQEIISTGSLPKTDDSPAVERTFNDGDDDDEKQTQIIDVDESEKDETQVEIEKSVDEKTDDDPKDDVEVAKIDSSGAIGAYLLPSDDLDPVSDVEDTDFPDYQKLSTKERRRKRKKIRRRDSSVDGTAKADRELEEGEIEDDKTRRKRELPGKKRGRINESDEHTGSSKKQKRRKERKDENKGSSKAESSFTWKKLSKSTKERNYRDGKAKSDKPSEKNRERESNKKKEKRKEIERYDVRKIVSEKPRIVRDEFGRDVSAGRSRSRSVSLARSYNSRRRASKEHHSRRSLSQDDRWIDWSPVWSQRRSRSRTRRSPRSRSPRNRSRLSGDRYRNVSKGRRPREYVHDKRDARKRRRSLSSLDRFSPTEKKRTKRSPRERERSRRRSGSCINARRMSLGDTSDHFYRERSWSRSPTLYAHLTPEPNPYSIGRYERSPSIMDPPARISVVSPDETGILTPNPQNLTVIVPNVDATKKKHKKKKDSKKKKKKPSKEVFTSGDNIVVSVNFDDNQKIISAKSSKRKNDEENARSKKKKNSARKKRKQNLRVGEEVLNAKPVAVIDLNSSPCKEMSPMEVISLTDSGDENATNDNAVVTSDRNRTQTSGEVVTSAYVMTSAGPKTPPEPSSIKFTVGSTGALRTIPTNPIFAQDDLDHVDNSSLHYTNKGPNTPPEPSNTTPNATMYDPFEPTKSRSASPVVGKENNLPEQRQSIDIFADDVEKTGSEGPISDKSAKQNEDNKDGATTVVSLEESQPNKPSPVKETNLVDNGSGEGAQVNGVNTLVLDLSSLGDDFVPKSSIPLVKTSQGKYEFQSSKATPDKPITVVIAQQNTSVKPQPQQVMVTPTRQIPTKPVEPIKQPMFPDILPWKLPPLSQVSFATPPPAVSTVTPTTLIGSSTKTMSGALAQNGAQNESFDLDDSPYSPASSEGDDLFEPPPLNANLSPKSRSAGASLPAVNSYKARVDALFNSSPAKKYPRPTPHMKPVSAIKGAKKISKPNIGGKKEVGIKADEEQLKILDDVPNSAVEMIVKEKFLKKLHRQERVVEEVKVVLKPHYAKKHISKEEYKDILRRAVPKICHNKSGDINPSKIQGLVEAYVKRIRHSKKKGLTMNTLPSSNVAPMFPSMAMANTAKTFKKQKTLWG